MRIRPRCSWEAAYIETLAWALVLSGVMVALVLVIC